MVKETPIKTNSLVEWTQRSVNRRIFMAAATVGSMTLLVKAVAMLKEMAVARAFGTSVSLDAYLLAFAVPSFAISVVSGSFNAALVPTFIEVRDPEGHDAAQRLFSNATCWSMGLLGMVAMVLALTAPAVLGIVAGRLEGPALDLARTLYLLFLPVVIINGLAANWAGILNASERFWLAAVSPAMPSLAAIASLMLFGSRWGILALLIGFVGGSVLQLAGLALGLNRQGISVLPRWHGMTPATRQVIHQYAPTVAGGILMSSTSLFDQTMASWLGSGSVATLNYAYKIVALVNGICVMALGTAVLPYFSRMSAERDWAGIRRTLGTYVRLLVVTTVPLALLLAVFSQPLVRVLFEGGAFSAEDSRRVALAQSLLALQIPFYALGILHVRLISSLKANRLLFWGTCISVVVNVGMNLLFMRWLGVAGIALSTSTVYIVSFCYLRLSLLRELRRAERMAMEESQVYEAMR